MQLAEEPDHDATKSLDTLEIAPTRSTQQADESTTENDDDTIVTGWRQHDAAVMVTFHRAIHTHQRPEEFDIQARKLRSPT